VITDLTAGTGRFSAIPKDALVEMVPSRGVAELLDTIRVRHVSGGLSTIGLKSYEKGREKWQGEMLDYVWFDEEPASDVYLEGLTRMNVGNKPCWMTFTPLLGMSETVRRFSQQTMQWVFIMSNRLGQLLHLSFAWHTQCIKEGL
jgi:phage terminase large subunit-like protein